MRKRVGWAFVATPFVATGYWGLGTFVQLAVMDGWAAAVRDVPPLIIGAGFGFPVALVATLVAGALYAGLDAKDSVSGRAALVSGAMIGAVTLGVIGVLISSPVIVNPVLGALVGLATAATWMQMAGPTRPRSGGE